MGVEIKTVGDLLSSLVDGRFTGHQLPGLLATYEIRWLLVEGMITADLTQKMVVMRHVKGSERFAWQEVPGGWQRPWKYEDVESWLFSMERAGMRRAHTADRRGTAAWLAALYRNWTKPWEAHTAHLGVQYKDLGLEGEIAMHPLEQYVVSKKMRVAMALGEPGIGRVRAEAAAAHFRSNREMVNATEEEWRKVTGFGKKLAAAMVKAATEENGHV